ncbi:MAG: NAD+ synthase [Bacteroidetes bacterium QS_9_68_14]|nr:MAG: NAD+ synthase [Bacteroidetes bacterium QS_9_68_14]
MNIALAQINPTVGDLGGNADLIVRRAEEARRRGAELAVFPELCLTGYPPQDLLEQPAFVEATQAALRRVARAVPPGMGVVVGAPVPNETGTGKHAFNAAVLLENGERVAAVHKRLLPTYDVFDEHRYFEPAREQQVIEWRGLRLGLHICEDMWSARERAAHRLYDEDPLGSLAAQDPDLFINISASPFSAGKHGERDRLVEEICRRHERPFLLCNTVGANTEIVFDGDSRVHRASGEPVCCAESFAEDLLVWDPETGDRTCYVRRDPTPDRHAALTLGIRDYVEKTGLFEKALVGLSGGIDSAVTCALAAEALGAERVVGVTMPSKYSSEGSVTDSEKLAGNLGIELREIAIKPAVRAFDEMLAEAFAGTEEGVAEENIQARARGLTLMALSNKFGHLLLSTGNKSEMAVGYSTLYGDMSGGLAVLSDVLKTDVYALARFINEEAGRAVIPQNTIEKPPSAELAAGQRDADSLPPYDTLDEILRRYIEEKKELAQIVRETGLARDLVHGILRKVDRTEYKRRQAPPGLRVSEKAFGMGRRLPIVMRWDREAVRAETAPAG